MRVKLTNLLAAALVSLVVSATFASASGTQFAAKPAPLPSVGAHSLADVVKAQGRRIDKLQLQLALVKTTASNAADDAASAVNITDCVTTAAVLIERADGTIVSADAGQLADDSDSFIVPTLDDSCTEPS